MDVLFLFHPRPRKPREMIRFIIIIKVQLNSAHKKFQPADKMIPMDLS